MTAGVVMSRFGTKAATAGIALVSASVIAAAPSVTAPPPPSPMIQHSAPVQLTAFDPFSLTDWLTRIATPPSATAPFPVPPSLLPPVIGLQNIDSTVKTIYGWVEPWVHYGFQLAQYALGFVPYVGWLSPQVDIFYHLGERIVRSAIFNTTEWLTGQGSFGQNLGQFAVDTINSFIFFANDQIHFWLPALPPIPPLPPIFGPGVLTDSQAATASVSSPTMQPQLTARTPTNTVDLDTPKADLINVPKLNLGQTDSLGAPKKPRATSTPSASASNPSVSVSSSSESTSSPAAETPKINKTRLTNPKRDPPAAGADRRLVQPERPGGVAQ
jgi:hypothetical protein